MGNTKTIIVDGDRVVTMRAASAKDPIRTEKEGRVLRHVKLMLPSHSHRIGVYYSNTACGANCELPMKVYLDDEWWECWIEIKKSIVKDPKKHWLSTKKELDKLSADLIRIDFELIEMGVDIDPHGNTPDNGIMVKIDDEHVVPAREVPEDHPIRDTRIGSYCKVVSSVGGERGYCHIYYSDRGDVLGAPVMFYHKRTWWECSIAPESMIRFGLDEEIFKMLEYRKEITLQMGKIERFLEKSGLSQFL